MFQLGNYLFSKIIINRIKNYYIIFYSIYFILFIYFLFYLFSNLKKITAPFQLMMKEQKFEFFVCNTRQNWKEKEKLKNH